MQNAPGWGRTGYLLWKRRLGAARYLFPWQDRG